MRFDHLTLAFFLGFLAKVLTLASLPGSTIVDTSPNLEFETRLEYARVLSYQKLYPEALEQYSKLLKQQPQSVELKLRVAQIHYYQHENNAAEKLLSDIPLSERTSEVELLMADIYIAREKYREAEILYRRNLDQIRDERERDTRLLKLAEVYSWEKRYPDSLIIYQKLISKYPSDIQLKRKYAFVLTWAAQYAEAAKIFKETLD